MSPVPQTEWIWRDGQFIRWEEATLHVMSHVVHYGSSIFEGIRCYETPAGGAIFRLPEHVRRFYDSCRTYRMEPGPAPGELTEACQAVVRKNGLEECYIRPLAVRGVGAAGVDPSASPVETYLICWPWGAYLGGTALEEGVDVCVSSWNRPAPNTHPVQTKAGGNYVNAALMKMQAAADGYSEAVALGTDGRVSEGSGQNLFMVRDGTLLTPPSGASILAGITRDAVMTLAGEARIPVLERDITRESLYVADELFFTGTAAEVTPIRSVDRIPVGDGSVGPITRRLQTAYLDIARGREPDRHGWLTPIAEGAGNAGGRARVAV
jgi:branched-chain amino acid aminotransferase